METLVLLLDLGGTFVFAISGAIAGVRHRLDIFGLLVVAYVAGNVGGITRDVLIGAIPPPAITDWRYIAVSLAAGLATFWRPSSITRMGVALLVFDAAGLALFAVSGTLKALAFHVDPLGAVLLGMLTGIGGGILRDVLVSEIPTVLHAELYAVAALACSVVVAAGETLGLPSAPVVVAGGSLCFGLRLVALRRGWTLPVARQAEEGDAPTGVSPGSG